VDGDEDDDDDDDEMDVNRDKKMRGRQTEFGMNVTTNGVGSA
jgi:hypothetical protein